MPFIRFNLLKIPCVKQFNYKKGNQLNEAKSRADRNRISEKECVGCKKNSYHLSVVVMVCSQSCSIPTTTPDRMSFSGPPQPALYSMAPLRRGKEGVVGPQLSHTISKTVHMSCCARSLGPVGCFARLV